MAIFHCYVSSPEGKYITLHYYHVVGDLLAAPAGSKQLPTQRLQVVVNLRGQRRNFFEVEPAHVLAMGSFHGFHGFHGRGYTAKMQISGFERLNGWRIIMFNW